MLDETLPIRVVEMWPREFECVVCEARGPWRYGLAMYEGEIVPDDAPEWAGFTCCDDCYQLNKDRTGIPLHAAQETSHDD